MPKENDNIPTGLYWQGKRTEVERISLPFQTIETINESRATRDKEKDTLFRKTPNSPLSTPNSPWYNRLIWGDNKYVMSSLLDEFAGKIDLICIDPPFATGADFSIKIESEMSNGQKSRLLSKKRHTEIHGAKGSIPIFK